MNSVNHHYIPQLYLRGFTSSDGKLQVFDKYYGTFKPDKQTPKTVLFEKHRNTINFHGMKSDIIEKLYSAIESPYGKLFNYIRGGLSQDDVFTEKGIYLLKLFIALQFWRMPLLDSYADNFINNMNLSGIGDVVTINGKTLDEIDVFRELLDTDKGFRHYFRSFFLPIITFDLRLKDNDFTNWKIHSVSQDNIEWHNLLTGDNPLLIGDMSEMFTFNSKFMLPLSKNQLLTYSPDGQNSKSFPPIFSSKLAMAMFAQCQKYVVGANRDYMKNIIDLHKSFDDPNNPLQLHKDLFAYI